jgi:hypothetical protein
MLQIYVVQLENDKWFLHISNDTNYDNIMFECQTLYDFVKKNAPIKIYETLKLFDQFDINAWTKRYMVYFGIDNVRGGIYSDEILPDYLIKTIENEIAFSIENHKQKLSMFDNIRCKENVSILDYQEKMNKYTELLNIGYGKITRDLFEDLEWIKTIVEKSTDLIQDYKPGMSKNSTEDINKYNSFIKKIELLNNYYYQLDEEKIRVSPNVLLKKPQFVFDKFFYHSDIIRDLDTEINNALEILKKYEFMGYTLINVIDETEYDLLA